MMDTRSGSASRPARRSDAGPGVFDGVVDQARDRAGQQIMIALGPYRAVADHGSRTPPLRRPRRTARPCRARGGAGRPRSKDAGAHAGLRLGDLQKLVEEQDQIIDAVDRRRRPASARAATVISRVSASSRRARMRPSGVRKSWAIAFETCRTPFMSCSMRSSMRLMSMPRRANSSSPEIGNAPVEIARPRFRARCAGFAPMRALDLMPEEPRRRARPARARRLPPLPGRAARDRGSHAARSGRARHRAGRRRGSGRTIRRADEGRPSRTTSRFSSSTERCRRRPATATELPTTRSPAARSPERSRCRYRCRR